jgi:sigma-B regulation protein RsbU (phosphoserine phosphatase)
MRVCCEPVLREHPALTPSSVVTERQADLDPVPASVSVARTLVRESLAGFDRDARDVALLLTSELVTNAILHARTPVQLGVLVDGGRALVCVADRLAESPTLSPSAHSHDRPGGRGLALVEDLADTWGTTTYTGGKTVWFVLQTAGDRSLTTG